MARDKFLGIYLNDHLAVLVGTRELLERSLESNRGTPLGDVLGEILSSTEEEQAALEALMKRQGVAENRAKTAGAWLAERVGRLKLNGQLTGYSDLSRLVEIEGAAVAVEAKRLFWDALTRAGIAEAGGLQTAELSQRAEGHRDQLKSHHQAAAKQAIGLVSSGA